MSYSRWGDSRWYTMWSSVGSMTMEYKLPTRKLKYSQTFQIVGAPTYYVTYGELKTKPIEQIIEEIIKACEADEVKATQEEINELKTYLIRFQKDVDDSFKWNNFFLYEWWYPIRNIFYQKFKIAHKI